MKFGVGVVAVSAFVWSLSCAAQSTPPASAPAGTTAQCKDGSFYSGASHRGACSRHGGVDTWYGPGNAGTAQGSSAATAAKSATGPAAGGSGVGASTSPAARAVDADKTASAAKGGGAGQVWVNTSSKVYHCPGDRYYGKTKQGQYMTEAAAKAAGDRPDHNKPCG